MSDASELITAAAGGNADSLRQLLIQLQRTWRLTAAIFLPNLREVDTVVLRLGTVVASSLTEVPLSDPLPWLRGRLRELIAQRLDELARNPAYSNDPVQRLMLSSGRERLTTVPVDADAATAITARLRFMSKGATDLLTLRFTNGAPFAQIAEQRRMSLDDVSLALQTACRQLDWTGDASGGTLEAEDYRAIDGIVCSNDAVIEGLGLLRAKVLDDMGLTLRLVRAARLHLIAAAWHAPELVVETPVLARAQPPIPATPTRRISNPQVMIREAKPRGLSTPTRRLLARKDDDHRVSSIDAYPIRSSRTGLITTLIGGALVLSGVALFLLHHGSTELPAPAPIKTAPPAQQPAPTITTPSTPVTPVVNAEPTAATPIVPIAITEPVAKPLFGADASPAPLAVWSTRLLVAGYRGPLLRVRRSGDQAESDITTTSGSLDTAALLKFTSRSSAHVMCWYDQSGNNHHLRQEDKDKQPRIIVDGELQSENSKPVIAFDHRRFDYLSTPSAITLGCLYAVVKTRSHAESTQGLFGSLAKNTGNQGAYFPIVDRGGKGQCEWWVGQQGVPNNQVRKPIALGRLMLWHSSSDGQKRPKLVLRLDGKEVGSVTCASDALTPLGPTTVGCVYWQLQLADPFGGMLGEMFVLPPGSSSETRGEITRNLTSWWKIP